MGVRGRVQASFALGGLLVSAFLAAVSWSLTTTYLYAQRELTATRSALVSADLLTRRTSEGESPTARSLVESVTVGNDAVYLPADLEGGVAATPRVGPADLPRPLLESAARGVAAQQRILVDGDPALAIALPLASGGVYVEVFPLTALDETLQILGGVLAGTAALATVLAAGLGRWATQRTLRPLRVLVGAASDVARGDLTTRLDGAGDPDLEPLAEALNTTSAALRARIERDARFAGDVSHELRSPITTMLNATALLRNRREQMSPEAGQVVDLLHEEVDRFRELVQDLLEISRADQQPDLHLQRTRLADLVRTAADREAGRPVTCVSPEAEDALVDADPRRLERVVVNLVVNARIHGRGLRDVTVERVGDDVRVTVSDDGVGIDVSERERIFDRFFRGRASRGGAPGSGLGLALVAQHVRAHGGRVWVEDGVPVGAAFVVELPVAEPSA